MTITPEKEAELLGQIRSLEHGYWLMHQALCHIAGTSGVDGGWYRDKAWKVAERITRVGEITSDSNSPKPGDCADRGNTSSAARTLLSSERQEREKAEGEVERLSALAFSTPDAPGAFPGDLWFGHPTKRTMATHRWHEGAWEELPDEAVVLMDMLAAARAENEGMAAVVAWARHLLNGGLVNRGVSVGLVVVEKADKSDPHYQLCRAIERLEKHRRDHDLCVHCATPIQHTDHGTADCPSCNPDPARG